MSILSVSPLSLPNLCLGASIGSPTFSMLIAPLETILTEITPLESTSNRPITFTFDLSVEKPDLLSHMRCQEETNEHFYDD
ncbi:hypothetical protein ACFL6S_27845 [Candidatus Poribacteria bacterium]